MQMSNSEDFEPWKNRSGKPLGPVIGYKFTKKNTENGILLEIWSDESGEWKLVKSEIQNESNNKPVRIDDIPEFDKEFHDYCRKKWSVPNDHIDPPIMIGSNEDRLRAQGKLPPTEWELENEYFKTLNYDYEKDQKYALEHRIKCEHPGCEWIAEARCLECLRKKMGDHWFCRPMVFIQHYHGPYAFGGDRGREWIHYDHSHAHEHEKQVHPPKEGMYKWINLREVVEKDDRK